MKNQKPNISLSNISEIKNSGIALALRKGINEIFRTKTLKNRNAGAHYPKGSYDDMISVIICTANRGALAAKAAEAVLKQDFDNAKYEMIIVNNSVESFPYDFESDKIKIINEPILGLSRARNKGASAAKGEYLLYIDDDALINKGTLASMYSAFISHEQTAIIGGQIFLDIPDPVPEVFLEGRESLWSAYTVPYKSYREIREHYEFPYGACFGIRHSVLDLLGGFPENYGRTGNNFAGGEETALCFAARNMGYKIGIEPNASVLHCVSPDRFTKEHIKRTIAEGILTTYRLYKDGYSQNGWTSSYVSERINIIEKELIRLNNMAYYYKKCELDAFITLQEIMKQNSTGKD